jgi:hypothetical protein
MRGGNVCSVMRGGRGRCTHHAAARRHSHSHPVRLHHAAHPLSTRTTVLHPRGACPPHTTSHHTRHCPLLTDTHTQPCTPPGTTSRHCLSTQTSSTYNPLLTGTLSPQTACSSQATLNTICSSQISNNSLLLTSFTLLLSAPHRQAVLHSLLLTSARTHTHTHNFTHSTTSNTTSPPTQLPSSSPVSHSTPRLREPLLN